MIFWLHFYNTMFFKLIYNWASKHNLIHSLNLQFIAMFTIATAIFDVYCLAMAAPGSTHYGYFLISYEFVYVGNKHGNWSKIKSIVYTNNVIFLFPIVRNAMIIFALFSLLTGFVVFCTSVLLVIALRKVNIFHEFVVAFPNMIYRFRNTNTKSFRGCGLLPFSP